MKKSAQVVMLPTNEKANVGSIVTRPSDNRMAIVNVLTKDDPQHCIHQHLYILSDEEIKEGDWFIMNSCIVRQCSLHKGDILDTIGGLHHESVCKKIIATTDKSLSKTIKSSYVQFGDNVEETRIEFLPQPSQPFIEHFVSEYNKGNVITDVMVEYEEKLTQNTVNSMMFVGMNIKDAKTELNLKINSDNTINISMSKDSWSREEVTTLLYSLNRDKEGNFDCTKWIEENL